MKGRKEGSEERMHDVKTDEGSQEKWKGGKERKEE